MKTTDTTSTDILNSKRFPDPVPVAIQPSLRKFLPYIAKVKRSDLGYTSS